MSSENLSSKIDEILKIITNWRRQMNNRAKSGKSSPTIRRREVINMLLSKLTKGAGKKPISPEGNRILQGSLSYLERIHGNKLFTPDMLTNLKKSISNRAARLQLPAEKMNEIKTLGKPQKQGLYNRWVIFHEASSEDIYSLASGQLKSPDSLFFGNDITNADSTNVLMGLYDIDKKELHVIFINKKEYEAAGLDGTIGGNQDIIHYVAPRYYIYERVPSKLWAGMLQATSRGSFIHANFIDKVTYKFRVVWGPPRITEMPAKSYKELRRLRLIATNYDRYGPKKREWAKDRLKEWYKNSGYREKAKWPTMSPLGLLPNKVLGE